MIKTFNNLLDAAKAKSSNNLVLINGVDQHSLEAGIKAVNLGLINLTITGDKKVIEQNCFDLGVDANKFRIIDANSVDDAATIALKLIADGKANSIMKGLISSDKYMRMLLNKEYNMIGEQKLLTHLTVLRVKEYHKFIFASDVAIIPYPTLEQKKIIIKFMINAAKAFEIERPKVALIAPTEQIIKSIPACVDAEILTQMGQSGEFGNNTVFGPVGLDVAIDKESAEIKGIKSDISGDADCLLFPNIDAGNVFYKTASKFCNAQQAAVVLGSKVPAILSSRSDSVETKLNSIALATILSNN